MAQKSKLYYRTRSAVRGAVKMLILLAVYVILHIAASSIWSALFFIAIVTCGFAIYDHKTKTTTSHT